MLGAPARPAHQTRLGRADHRPPSQHRSPAGTVARCVWALLGAQAMLQVAGAEPCAGGTGLALTPALYAQGRAAYQDATCIPDYAFCQYDNPDGSCDGGRAFAGDVVLADLLLLESIGQYAFRSFAGRLQLIGSATASSSRGKETGVAL